MLLRRTVTASAKFYQPQSSGFLSRLFLYPALPATLALPDDRTLGPFRPAFRLAPKIHRRGGQFLCQGAFSFSFLLLRACCACCISQSTDLLQQVDPFVKPAVFE